MRTNHLAVLFLIGCTKTGTSGDSSAVAVDERVTPGETDEGADGTPEEEAPEQEAEAGDPNDDLGGLDASDPESEDEAEEEEEIDPQIVRFVALGDGGEGNAAQYAVGAAMKNICDSKTDEDGQGCEFALYLGDNFYNEGVESIDDPQFESKFEAPYADIDFPFYVVLGNHDYGELSLDFFRVPHQVAYTERSSKWNMPNEFYTKNHEHALFIGLDTNAIMVESVLGDSGQDSWLSGIHATNEATWTIAFGHHPYVSNGRHGNAGSYEGFSFIPIVSGESVKEFFDEHICGMVDVYFSGHDHNRQWLNPTCGTEFIVSGAASKNTDLEGRGTPTFWEDDTTPGFVWIELRDNVMTGEFYNQDAVLEFTRTVTK